MSENQGDYPVSMICRVAGVSTGDRGQVTSTILEVGMLPIKAPRQLTENQTAEARGSLHKLLDMARWSYRNDGDRVEILGSSGVLGPLVWLEDLQDEHGQVRDDADEILLRGPGLPDESDSDDVHAKAVKMLNLNEREIDCRTGLQCLALELVLKRDSVQVIREFVEENPSIRFYRIRVADCLLKREMFWRLMASSAAGNTGIDGIKILGRFPPSISAQDLSTFIASVFAVPLAARVQPITAGFTTRRGAPLLGVISRGGARRPPTLPSWPTASMMDVFSHGAIDVYATSAKHVPSDWATQIPRHLELGVNTLAEFVTDPAFWRLPDGEIDLVERNCVLGSTFAGITALTELADTWGSSSHTWSAFRALTILQGIWERDCDGTWLRLRHLLDPRLIQRELVPRIQPLSYRQWVSEVNDRYKVELRKIDNDLDIALDKMENIRNLVHGAATTKRGMSRESRLIALRDSQSARPVIADVANWWWTAVLTAPLDLLKKRGAPQAADRGAPFSVAS